MQYAIITRSEDLQDPKFQIARKVILVKILFLVGFYNNSDFSSIQCEFHYAV